MTCLVVSCPRKVIRNGMCHAHAEWARRHGKTPTHLILDTLEARFMAKVEKQANGCWLWTASTGGDGRYGAIGVDGKLKRAHRVAYELFKGPIPEGLTLDHLCRTTLCVNPDHLEPVTHKVNVLRGESKQAENAVKTHCPRDHPYDITVNHGKGRWCSICQREASRDAQRRYRAKKRAEAARTQ